MAWARLTGIFPAGGDSGSLDQSTGQQRTFLEQNHHLITLQDPEAKYSLPLIEKEQINHNTQIFRFGLPSLEDVLGFLVGTYVHRLAQINNVLVIRAYNPVSSDNNQGFVDLIIKIYFKNVHSKYPGGGEMIQYLENLKIGDTILFQGPPVCLFYYEPGDCALLHQISVYSFLIDVVNQATGVCALLHQISVYSFLIDVVNQAS
ncbi:NADH-cytochrome b5 reductase 2-like, partial [Psammomys obesus]|uniref:NADH-cytochrome b5 reductase 2-like n=1 Tax=Psammomys obesus TaxID=48139 RepID=UPI00245289A2